jgi:hypothetical protein
MPTHRFDPKRRGEDGRGYIGWYGPYPWHPCNCGSEEFEVVGDWGFGYRCVACGEVFDNEQD